MKKISLISMIFGMIFLAGCGKNTTSTITSSSSSSSYGTGLSQINNVQSIEILPVSNITKKDCSQYDGNIYLKAADSDCNGKENLNMSDTTNGYVVDAYNSNTTTLSTTSDTNYASQILNSDSNYAPQSDLKKNAFYHPDSVPVYGPGIHVNDTNANLKMGYGPYETNTTNYSLGY